MRKLTAKQYRTDRRACLVKVQEARALMANATGLKRAAFGHVEFACLDMMAALRAEYYRKDHGALHRAQARHIRDMQALCRRKDA